MDILKEVRTGNIYKGHITDSMSFVYFDPNEQDAAKKWKKAPLTDAVENYDDNRYYHYEPRFVFVD